MLRANCPAVSMTLRLGEKQAIRGGGFTEDQCSRVLSNWLTPLTPCYCFVHKLHQVCLVIEIRRVKPNVHILLCWHSLQRIQLLVATLTVCRAEARVWKGEGDVKFLNSPPRVIISSFAWPCTNLRCDTPQSVCDLRGRLVVDDEKVFVAGYISREFFFQ